MGCPQQGGRAGEPFPHVVSRHFDPRRLATDAVALSEHCGEKADISGIQFPPLDWNAAILGILLLKHGSVDDSTCCPHVARVTALLYDLCLTVLPPHGFQPRGAAGEGVG